MIGSVYAVIMAGGSGERLWPKSRPMLPKQFVTLYGNRSLLQHTYSRMRQWLPAEQICVVVGERHAGLVAQQLPELPAQNMLLEPVPRDTAACAGFAAAWVQKKTEDGVMILLPSDHLILDDASFHKTLGEAVEVARATEGLVTLGIRPTRPETGYGYIEVGEHLLAGEAHRVARFKEKPDLTTAMEFLTTGQFLWNSGIFIWKTAALRQEIERLLPDLAEGLATMDAVPASRFQETMTRLFPSIPKYSIDRGLLERSGQVYVVPAVFGWDDLGSWLSLERIRESDADGNCLNGPVVAESCSNLIVEAGERLMVAFGVQDLVLVDTEDYVLAMHRSKAQEMRSIVEKVKEYERSRKPQIVRPFDAAAAGQ
ncbi:MAG: mannose-1-phosphate guanylyltransferase [Bacillota bacterium]